MGKQYTAEQLADVLDKHGKWLRGEESGERANLSTANLSDADLSNADLSYANLSRADLRYVDLSNAKLSGANLRYVDLSYANLSRADLRSVNLSGANLSCANLSYASLSGADLGGANLSGANLSSANLRHASLYVSAAEGVRGIQLLVLHLSRHRIVYRGDTNTVQIGCKQYTLEYWLEHYAEIGRSNGYSDSDIALYGGILQQLKVYLSSVPVVTPSPVVPGVPVPGVPMSTTATKHSRTDSSTTAEVGDSTQSID